jgi:hypothetical protein
LYAETQLHHDAARKIIMCRDDWGLYWAGKRNKIIMETLKTKHGYHYCQHVHVVKYTCHDFVAYLKTWDTYFWGYYSTCRARESGDGGRMIS